MSDLRRSLRFVGLVWALLPWALPVWGNGEIGALFTKVNAYVYPDSPSKGRRILVRPRQTFTVVDLTRDREDRIWLRIHYPQQTRKIEGEGWTPMAPHELINVRPKLIEVYSDTLEENDSPFNYVRVPAASMKLLNLSKPSTRYSQITWQKVRYSAEVPLTPWIREGTSIYRPGKSEVFLNRVYGEMVSRNVNNKILFRLLSGVIRVGDTTLEVEWALGKPLRIQEEVIANTKRTIWQYPTLVVQFQNKVVEQIN